MTVRAFFRRPTTWGMLLLVLAGIYFGGLWVSRTLFFRELDSQLGRINTMPSSWLQWHVEEVDKGLFSSTLTLVGHPDGSRIAAQLGVSDTSSSLGQWAGAALGNVTLTLPVSVQHGWWSTSYTGTASVALDLPALGRVDPLRVLSKGMPISLSGQLQHYTQRGVSTISLPTLSLPGVFLLDGATLNASRTGSLSEMTFDWRALSVSQLGGQLAGLKGMQSGPLHWTLSRTVKKDAARIEQHVQLHDVQWALGDTQLKADRVQLDALPLPEEAAVPTRIGIALDHLSINDGPAGQLQALLALDTDNLRAFMDVFSGLVQYQNTPNDASHEALRKALVVLARKAPTASLDKLFVDAALLADVQALEATGQMSIDAGAIADTATIDDVLTHMRARLDIAHMPRLLAPWLPKAHEGEPFHLEWRSENGLSINDSRPSHVQE